MDKLVYFVIVNYNGAAVLQKCINSILNQVYKNHKILIVDNHSNDDSCKLIKTMFPPVKIIRLKNNFGYAKASNIAINEALKENPDFIAFVNTDVVLKNEWLNSLLEFMNDQHYDSAQSVITSYESENIIDSKGISISKDLRIYDRDHGKIIKKTGNHETIFGPCFAAALLKTKTIQKLITKQKFFNEEFLTFYEDVDCCFRANQNGFKAGLYDEPLCKHRRSFTADKQPFYKYFFIGRNYFLLLGSYFSLQILLKKMFPIMLDRCFFLFYTLGHPVYSFAFITGSIAGIIKAKKSFLSSDRNIKTNETLVKEVLVKIQDGFYA